MTNLNQIGELHETAMYELLLNRARDLDPSDEKACESFIEKVEHQFILDLISSGMAQRIVSTLCQRRISSPSQDE